MKLNKLFMGGTPREPKPPPAPKPPSAPPMQKSVRISLIEENE